MSSPSLKSLEKALALLEKIATDGGEGSLSTLAADLGLPLSTAHRIAATLERHGFVTRLQRGHYLPGPRLLRLTAADGLNRVIVGVGRPIIARLAKQARCTAHLGVFEDGMVTYLLKSEHSSAEVFTREGTQLEAYCTGIGKVLLAALPAQQLEDYLKTGPFIRLTDRTLIEPTALRAELVTVKQQSYAMDDAEMDVDLACLAVPVRSAEGDVIAAISISRRHVAGGASSLLPHLETLHEAANALTQRLTPCL